MLQPGWFRRIFTRTFLIDTATITLLTSVPAAVVEFFLLDMPAEDVLGVRTFAFCTSLATGGLYGKWRDFCLSLLIVDQDSRRQRAMADFIANVPFTIVLYPIQLLSFGASAGQTVRGTTIALVACAVVGPITGIVLEIARAGFRPRAVLQILRPRAQATDASGERAA